MDQAGKRAPDRVPPGVDPAVHELFSELLQALEAVVVTLMLEETGRQPASFDRAVAEASRRIVQFRHTLDAAGIHDAVSR